MSDELIRILLELLVKIFDCNLLEMQKLKIIESLVGSNYLNELVYKIIDKNPNDIELIRSVMSICHSILILNPARLNDLIKTIDKTELTIFRVKSKELINEFDEKIGEVKREIEEQTKKRILPKIEKILTSTNLKENENKDPPEIFYEVPIIPSLDEITSKKPTFLIKNIINGAYKSVEQYLDIHFRLLREDFLRPLREGINEFRDIIEEEKRTKAPNLQSIESRELMKKISTIDGLRAYLNVTFSEIACSEKGLSIILQLDAEKLKNVKWESSKRLMFGSLVCLSNDFFNENFIVAVVCDSDPRRLKKGIVNVKLEDFSGINIDEEFLINDQKKYIMFETTAFYEAYCHVLNALKCFKDDNFPFKSQIVECIKDTNPPDYLIRSPLVDLRTLISENTDIDPHTGNYLFTSSIDYAKKCSIYDERRWPSPTQMNLDESQYKAIKLALTQKITLIQGPPGTGKTFIGVKIVKMLLNNRNLWCWNLKNGQHVPILMICYTNHALDQFLEYCMKECNLNERVVRIGGRSQSKHLESFLLKNVKNKARKERKLDKSLFKETMRQRDEVRELENQIKNHLKLVSIGKRKIIPLHELGNVMQLKYYQQLKTEEGFLNWLGFEKKNQENNSSEQKEEKFNSTNDDSFRKVDNKGEAINPIIENIEKITKKQVESKKEENISSNAANTIKFGPNNTVTDEDSLSDYYDDKEENDRMLDEDFEIAMNTKILKIQEDENDFDLWKFKEKFNIINDDGFRKVGNKGVTINPIKEKIEKITKNQVEKEIYTNNLWSLSEDDRICLYTYWANLFRKKQNEEIKYLKPKYTESLKSLSELRLQEDMMIMQNALIGIFIFL